MAEDIASGGEAAKQPQDAASNTEPKSEPSSELPQVDAPALSPASDAPETVPDAALILLPPAAKAGAQGARPRFRIRPRYWRQTVFAASVATAAGTGVLIGSLLAGSPSAPPPAAASLHQQQALQQTIGHLSKEVAGLKASLAAERKMAKSEIAKIADRLQSTSDITGSIPTPRTSVPIPRPAVRTAVTKSRVVPDWAIRDVRDGFVYVQSHDDIYQVVRGAPLPGLGPVQEIARRSGRWVVVTPRGLIVSLRDRRFFETN
jgi:hypothetical protein